MKHLKKALPYHKTANLINRLLVPCHWLRKHFNLTEFSLDGTETLYLFNGNSKWGLESLVILSESEEQRRIYFHSLWLNSVFKKYSTCHFFLTSHFSGRENWEIATWIFRDFFLLKIVSKVIANNKYSAMKFQVDAKYSFL